MQQTDSTPESKFKLIPFTSLLQFLIIIVYLLSNTLFSQTPANDFTVVLHEEALNKVFSAIGEIKGKNKYEVLLINGEYQWTVVNPAISIRPDSSQFNCLAKVEIGPITYTTNVKGDVKIYYDRKKNEIQITIVSAIFELYTVILGKKIHIKNIDIADNFKEPFVFEGPRTMVTDFEFTMPDSTKKHIYIKPSDCDMEIKWKEIVTRCEIMSSDKPFQSQAKDTVPKSNQATVPAKAAPKTASTANSTTEKK